MVGAITLIGLLVRLPSFNDSLYGDELSTFFIVTGNSLSHVVYLLEGGHSVDLNPPLYFIAAWFAERLGTSPELLRLPSLLAGTAAIPLTYLLGLWTVGRRAALVGAALVALSPFLIFYSTEARPFSLLLLLALLSTLALLRAIAMRRWEWWAAYAVCSCAAVYTNYTAIFFLAAQAGWALWTVQDDRKAVIAANLAAAVAYLPWLPAVIDDSGSPGVKVPEVLTPFTFDSLRVGLGHWALGHPLVSLERIPGGAALALAAAGIAVAALALGVRALRGRGRLMPSGGTILVAVLALSMPVGAALYSWLGPHSIWDSRQLIASAPALALGAGALLVSAGPRLGVLAAGLVVVGFAIGAAGMLDDGRQRPDYAGAVAFIDRAGAPGDPVVELPAPTPRPLTALDAAFADAGTAAAQRHPVLRVGLPSQRAMLGARPYARLPTPPTDLVVRTALRLARGGSLFAVVPASGAYARGLATATVRPGANDLREVRSDAFPGFVPVSVYEYRLGAHPPSRSP